MNIFDTVKNYGQEQLLRYWDQLDEAGKDRLSAEIGAVDFDMMTKLYENACARQGSESQLPGEMPKPMAAFDISAADKAEKKRLYDIGLEALRCGSYGALTLAGGQGSRLGHDGPKGTFDIGLDSHKSLFEIQCDDLKRSSEAAGRFIPWYIMTSDTNHNVTVDFFESHDYFGYPKEYISFFRQTMIPMLDKNGKILMAGPDKILMGPNGNGGIFVSLKNTGMLEDMKARGIKWTSTCNIDNCLIKMADPLFIGYLISSGKSVAAKSYIKRGPDEKAGVFCYRNGHPAVIEYTEIPAELAEMKDGNGQWMYGDANINNYIYSISVLEMLASSKPLPYHTAIKKMTFYSDGEMVTSSQADCYKFEQFIFDCLESVEDLALMRVSLTEEFAPVKNRTGVDSAESAREMYLKAHGSGDAAALHFN